jgi:predicted enzyme related to lactoylglutathione lyase
MKNAFCWVQLQSTNLPKAKEFYQKLFAWNFREDSSDPKNPYTHIDTGENPGGGMMAASPGVPSHWMPFIQVKDIVKDTTAAEKLGAKVIVQPEDITSGGRYSVIVDPTGATVGFYEPPKD